MPLKVSIHEKGGLRQYDAVMAIVREGATLSDYQEVLGDTIGKFVSSAALKHRFKGQDGDLIVLNTNDSALPEAVIMAGWSKNPERSLERLRRAGGNAIREAGASEAGAVAVAVVGTGSNLEIKTVGMALTEALILAAYRFKKYKTGNSAKLHLKTAALLLPDRKHVLQFEDGVRMGKLRAEATILARDLVNEPASEMVPKTLADAAKNIAADSKRITVTVRGRSEIEELKMGAYLGVAQGSINEPQLIHLVYKPTSAKPKKVIALIGKGITFDSGGLSLKPSHAMETMKCDMAGAAAVIGVFQALSKLDLPLEIHGIAPVAENMISATATRPGDILRSMSGKTIEVLNTDAEGRLTLIDAITYAKEYAKPDITIDLATLTGACISALGEDIAGFMGNNDELIDAIKQAAATSGEMFWQLPLPREYKPLMKSQIADYTNITPSKKGAGASTAGLFLQEFVGNTSWVHMDIAGPAFAESRTISYMPYGGTGFGVRTLIDFLEQQSQ